MWRVVGALLMLIVVTVVTDALAVVFCQLKQSTFCWRVVSHLFKYVFFRSAARRLADGYGHH